MGTAKLEAATTQMQTWTSELAAKAASAATPTSQAGAEEAQQPHPQFFVPGQIIHIYQQNGLGRAALAQCTHETFTRINPSANMLEDHLLVSYDEAMRQACIQ